MFPFHFIKETKLLLKNNYIQFGDFKDLKLYFEKYFKIIEELIFLSKYFGQSILNIQGPGGNISIKLNDIMLLFFIIFFIGFFPIYFFLRQLFFFDN